MTVRKAMELLEALAWAGWGEREMSVCVDTVDQHIHIRLQSIEKREEPGKVCHAKRNEMILEVE